MIFHAGCKNVTHFSIVSNSWHLSDHTPIDMMIQTKYEINALSLYICSKSQLEKTAPSRKTDIKVYRKLFDSTDAKAKLTLSADENYTDLLPE